MKKGANILVAVFAILLLQSCQKDKSLELQTVLSNNSISGEILSKIKSNGFSTANVQKMDDGYLVEGDIMLTNEFLDVSPTGKLLRIAEVEQYRTTELVGDFPRVITILVSNLGTSFVQGTDQAIQRFNDLDLQINFQRITSGTPDITITGFNQPPSGGFITLATSGFPSNGDPYNSIKINTNRLAYGTNPNAVFVGAAIQHELGHTIGFRHTDYMNRSYSCGGSAVNEGAGTTGAILIPGTPSGPDSNSWMLACTSTNIDRTFNANDIIALTALY